MRSERSGASLLAEVQNNQRYKYKADKERKLLIWDGGPFRKMHRMAWHLLACFALTSSFSSSVRAIINHFTIVTEK